LDSNHEQRENIEPVLRNGGELPDFETVVYCFDGVDVKRNTLAGYVVDIRANASGRIPFLQQFLCQS
jgi:hypothetical protein